jgi:hypothetical protein
MQINIHDEASSRFSQFWQTRLKNNNRFRGLTMHGSSIYRQLVRKIHVGYNAFVVPSPYSHKNCCSVGLSVVFEVKDNGDEDNDYSHVVIIIIIVECAKSHTVLE